MSSAKAEPVHRPYLDQYGVRCHDCLWAQELDEDLHEESRPLLAWHAANSANPVDHLDFFAVPLEIPDYIRWEDNNGLLALRDERTGGYYLRFNHECLAIFKSVEANGALEEAAVSEARRLGIARRLAMKDIVFIASSLYRKGLLRPATRDRSVASTDRSESP